MCYALGAGIAHYLGSLGSWEKYWLGQACVTLLQFMMIFMNEYFTVLSLPVLPKQGTDESDTPLHFTGQQALFGMAVVLTTSAALVGWLVFRQLLNPNALVIVVISFILAFFYAAPPTRWAVRGYGELVSAILVANLFPALAFLLQNGQVHRLLAMATFPLTLFYIAMGLALALPTYARDMKHGFPTLILRMGWKLGIITHNYLVLAGFLLLIVAMVIGLPWVIAWPCLLVVPVGLYQVWQMHQISEGYRPRWRLLSVAALATFGLVTYLLTIGFWLN